jgi:hypothetical protein
MEGVSKRSDQRDVSVAQTEDPSKEAPTTSNAAGSRSRRSFMRGAAVAGLSAAGVAATANGAAAYDGEYDHVVNVVEAGADNTGSTSINPILEELRADNTLLEFPAGEYSMDDQFRFTQYEKFGISGDGATIVPANYYSFSNSLPVLFRLGTRGNPGADLRFEGIEFDQRADDTGVRAIEGNVTDRLEVHDVRIRGHHDSGEIGPAHFNVVDSGGTGRVVDFRAEDGGAWADTTPNAVNTTSRGPVGIIANDTEGELTFRRCHLSGFPGSGLYATGGNGTIIVHGGVYRNNTSGNIRIGGTDSVVRWPTVVTDESNGREVGMRGIRLEHGNATIEGAAIRTDLNQTNCHPIAVLNSCTGAWIDETTIEVGGDATNHGIVVSPEAGETTIARTEIVHEPTGGYAIWARDSTSDERVLCSNIVVRGEAGTERGYRDGIRIERDDCRIETSEIFQPGSDRNGIANFSDGLTVYNTELRGSRWAAVDLGSEATYLSVDAASYADGQEAICLYDESRDASVRLSRVEDGIADYGSTNLETVSNTTT